MIYKCSQCRKKLRIPDTMAGRMATCPNCKNKFRVVPPETTVADDVAEDRVAVEPRPKRPSIAQPKKTQRPVIDDDGPPAKRSRETVDEEVNGLEEVGSEERPSDEEDD